MLEGHSSTKNAKTQVTLADNSDIGKQQYVAALCLDDHDPIELVVNRYKTFRVLVRTPSEALMIVRVLLSKIVYRRNLSVLTDAEQYLLAECWKILSEGRSRSMVQSKKQLVSSLLYIENCRTGTILNEKLDHTLWWKMLERKEGVMSPFAYFGWWGSHRIERFFRFRNRESERPCNANKRFIGVGYRDAGTARNVAFDASPSWQEVASVRLPFEKEKPFQDLSFQATLGKFG